MSDTSSREIASEIPVSIEEPDSALKRFAIAVGIVLLAVIWLVVGFALLGLSTAVAAILAVGFLLWWGWAILVTVFFHLTRRRYPLRFLFPLGPVRARTALRDAGNSSVAPTMAAAARGTILLFGPLVFLMRLIFGWKQSRERRERSSIIDLPLRGSTLFRATLRAVIDIAGQWKMLVDGFHESTAEYDGWVEGTFAEIGAFVTWWPLEELSVESYCVFTPLPFTVTSDVALESSLDLQPSPDPRGFPGLASAVIRRTRITGLRDLFHSASEIGGMGDPNLDDVPDCGVVRIVRTTNHSGQRWIVQVPSTSSWQPRAGKAPNDITADLSAASGRETSLLRGVLAAIAKAQIPLDAPVLLAGFSLGGIVAAQIATGKYVAPGYTTPHNYTATSAELCARADPSPAELCRDRPNFCHRVGRRSRARILEWRRAHVGRGNLFCGYTAHHRLCGGARRRLRGTTSGARLRAVGGGGSFAGETTRIPSSAGRCDRRGCISFSEWVPDDEVVEHRHAR